MPLPVGATLWSNEQTQVAPYAGYDVKTDYASDSGVLQLPVAGVLNNAAVLVQLHGGAMRKNVRVIATRAGLPPVLPALTPQNPANEALGSFSVVPQSPKLDGDGNTHVYVVSAAYNFFLVDPLAPEDGYRMGSPPYDSTPPNANQLGVNQFSTNIL